ncbi:MAG: hypothetical protein HZA93_17260 [Verrucomicrobia bacterium]|nr:hypothetical protein [Verrucomicrobiota bacterium]
MEDLLKDCDELGLVDELRTALALPPESEAATTLRAVRDLIYELACTRNRDLAVDALIHATGIAEFGRTSLRSYAKKHGITAEGFRLQVNAMQSRLHLPPRPAQKSDAN